VVSTYEFGCLVFVNMFGPKTQSYEIINEHTQIVNVLILIYLKLLTKDPHLLAILINRNTSCNKTVANPMLSKIGVVWPPHKIAWQQLNTRVDFNPSNNCWHTSNKTTYSSQNNVKYGIYHRFQQLSEDLKSTHVAYIWAVVRGSAILCRGQTTPIPDKTRIR